MNLWSGFVADTLTIFRKDLRIELRTGEIVTTAGFFAALVAILTAVAFEAGVVAEVPVGDRIIPCPTAPLPSAAIVGISVRVAPGAIWLAIAFASILALARTWQRERDDGALTGLLVSPISRGAIFLGKTLGVAAFVVAVECIVVPIVALMFHVELGDVIGALSVVLLFGTIGVAATGTLFGAMTVRTRARDLVLATVLFPLLMPSLLCSVVATSEILNLAQNAETRTAAAQLADTSVQGWLELLGVFDAVAVFGGLGIFGALVDD